MRPTGSGCDVALFTDNFGNAASRNHAFGGLPKKAVEIARGQVAKLIGADPGRLFSLPGQLRAPTWN
jgi:cysteine desulfurase